MLDLIIPILFGILTINPFICAESINSSSGQCAKLILRDVVKNFTRTAEISNGEQFFTKWKDFIRGHRDHNLDIFIVIPFSSECSIQICTRRGSPHERRIGCSNHDQKVLHNHEQETSLMDLYRSPSQPIVGVRCACQESPQNSGCWFKNSSCLSIKLRSDECGQIFPMPDCNTCEFGYISMLPESVTEVLLIEYKSVVLQEHCTLTYAARRSRNNPRKRYIHYTKTVGNIKNVGKTWDSFEFLTTISCSCQDTLQNIRNYEETTARNNITLEEQEPQANGETLFVLAESMTTLSSLDVLVFDNSTRPMTAMQTNESSVNAGQCFAYSSLGVIFVLILAVTGIICYRTKYRTDLSLRDSNHEINFGMVQLDDEGLDQNLLNIDQCGNNDMAVPENICRRNSSGAVQNIVPEQHRLKRVDLTEQSDLTLPINIVHEAIEYLCDEQTEISTFWINFDEENKNSTPDGVRERYLETDLDEDLHQQVSETCSSDKYQQSENSEFQDVKVESNQNSIIYLETVPNGNVTQGVETESIQNAIQVIQINSNRGEEESNLDISLDGDLNEMRDGGTEIHQNTFKVPVKTPSHSDSDATVDIGRSSPLQTNSTQTLHQEQAMALESNQYIRLTRVNTDIDTVFEFSVKRISGDRLKVTGTDFLDNGSYGVVTKEKLLVENDKFVQVAVKRLRSDADPNYSNSILNELSILIHIGKHPNVVELFGCYTLEEEIYIVLELCERGNLKKYMKRNKAVFLNLLAKDCEQHFPHSNFSTSTLTNWAYGIACGMEYLGSRKVIHIDLAARNVLLNENMMVKICDFGLSRQLNQLPFYVKKTAADVLPWQWMALESLHSQLYSVQSDVWSYGIILWELYSLGQRPYRGIVNNYMELIPKLSSGFRLSKPQYCTPEIYKLMVRCWSTILNLRPDFTELRTFFEQEQSRFQEKENALKVRVAARPADKGGTIYTRFNS